MVDSSNAQPERKELPGGGYLANAPIKTITVPDNRLRELRDYSGLAASMEEIGLLQPITVTESGVLVSGRHRLEAARSLGWETIPVFTVEDNDLQNRLVEIDENLKRLDLTVWEQSKHAEERERVLDVLGQRARVGDNQHGGTDTVSVPKTTDQIAKASGMSDKSWQRRSKIGREIGEQTATVLDHADVQDDKQRNLLNSTTQLDHLANISRKHGDEVAAEVAERALSTEGGNVFKEYDKVKGENVHYMSETDEWYTPSRVVDKVVEVLGSLDLDPCAEPAKEIPATSHFTKQDDGLSRVWTGAVYMNPPYGREILPWVEKLKKHHEAGDVPAAIALLPARTDTEWFSLLDGYPRCFVRGRLKFSGGKNSAPFPSAAVYMGNDKERFVEAFGDLGTVFERVGA